jgi:hypothetical protein
MRYPDRNSYISAGKERIYYREPPTPSVLANDHNRSTSYAGNYAQMVHNSSQVAGSPAVRNQATNVFNSDAVQPAFLSPFPASSGSLYSQAQSIDHFIGDRGNGINDMFASSYQDSTDDDSFLSSVQQTGSAISSPATVFDGSPYSDDHQRYSSTADSNWGVDMNNVWSSVLNVARWRRSALIWNVANSV